MAISNVDNDMRISNMIHGKIALSGFFQTLANTVGATDLFVPIDKNLILNGDVKMKDKNGKEILISEKAQTKFINNPIPSFTLELGYFNDIVDMEHFHTGWLLDDDLGITHFMFIWVLDADNDAQHLESFNEIHKVRICMISRESIFKMFSDNNLDSMELVERAIALLGNEEVVHDKVRDVVREGMTLIQSLAYYEKPLNLKVSFDLYLKYADFVVDCDLDTKDIKTVTKW